MFSALFIAWHSVPASPCAPHQISESAKVRYVHDGDTVHLKDGRKIRLIGINTPELSRHKQPAQPFAKQARLKLMALLRQSDYRVMLHYGLERKDKYQRTLAHLYLPNGLNLQQALLEQGMATAYTTPPNAAFSSCYRAAEAKARQQKRGLWRLAEYQIKPVGTLSRHDRGFGLVQGRVSHIRNGKKAISITLGNKLRLTISNRDRIYFPAPYLNSLKSRTILVRGWLHTKQPPYTMSLRHPDAISLEIN